MGYQPDDSRVIQYYEKSQLYFPVDPMMLHFVIKSPIPYHLNKTRQQLDALFDQITKSPLALRQTSRLKPWFQAMPYHDYKSPESFVKDLKWRFGIPELSVESLGFLEYMQALQNECFKNDVIIKNDVIQQSRFVVPFEKLESGSFEDGYVLVRRLQNITNSLPYEVSDVARKKLSIWIKFNMVGTTFRKKRRYIQSVVALFSKLRQVMKC